MKQPVRIGLENLVSNPPESISGRRLGLLCNPASVDRRFRHASELIFKHFPHQLKALFSPQHGFYAEKQDNMVESDHFIEPVMGIPVYSLYGETRVPTPEMFEEIDLLLVDIQDVGTRVYTFIYTISHCLETAARLNKKVVILDRPNPIGGIQVEGNLLEPQYASFVGRFPIPMRHGLTVGEICALFNTEFGIGCDLEIVPMTGWKRTMYWEDTGLCWIPPSPNLPTPLSCVVYPGQVILEGTNLSEGRGTTLPFELFGAPFIDPVKIKKDCEGKILGAHLRMAGFEPTSGKWQNQNCRGFHIHVLDRGKYTPYLSSLELVQTILRHCPEQFEWKQPPYEYEFEKLPMDLILGSRLLREQLTAQADLVEIAASWSSSIDVFKQISSKVYLYE